MASFAGAGMGVIIVMNSVYLFKYFNRYRGVAIGIKFVGQTIGSLVFPHLLLFLDEKYGLRGNLLIYSGISMNLSALTFLVKEPTWAEGHKQPKSNQNATDGVGMNTGHRHLRLGIQNGNSGLLRKFQKSGNHIILRHMIGLFRQPNFYLIIVMGIAIDYGKTVFNSNVVDYGRDKGFSLSQVELIISYSAAPEMVGFVLIPFLADRNHISRPALAMCGFFLLGLCFFLFPDIEYYAVFVMNCIGTPRLWL